PAVLRQPALTRRGPVAGTPATGPCERRPVGSMTAMKALASLLACALVLAATGCGDSGRPKAAAPTMSPVAVCVTDQQQRAGGFVATGPAGRPVSGVVLGTGTTGVVLANQSDGGLCQWQP